MGREYGEDIRDDQTGIVRSPLSGGSQRDEDAVRINGAWFYARVRHLRPAELRAELEAAGFGIVQQDGGRVLCTREQLPAMIVLDRLLSGILGGVWGSDQPHTVECSPDSVEDAHVRVMLDHGIGRASMGIQSMTEPVLENVSRLHHPSEALDACDRLVNSGLMVNVDLIYGLPGQTEENFRRDFTAVAERGVHTVTAYNLRVNEQTRVAKLLSDGEHLDLAVSSAGARSSRPQRQPSDSSRPAGIPSPAGADRAGARSSLTASMT